MAEKKQVPLRLSAKLYDAIAAWAEDDFRSVSRIEDKTANNTSGTMIIAVNYGARQEIVYAVNKILEKGEKVTVENISAKTQDGVLTITLPKSERAKIHRITVE